MLMTSHYSQLRILGWDQYHNLLILPIPLLLDCVDTHPTHVTKAQMELDAVKDAFLYSELEFYAVKQH